MHNNIVGIRFMLGGYIYNFDDNGLKLKPGQQVIVETEQGLALGVVQRVFLSNLLHGHPNPDFQLPYMPCQSDGTDILENDPPTNLNENSQYEKTGGQEEDNQYEKMSEQEEDNRQELDKTMLEQTHETSVFKKIMRLATPEDLKQVERNHEQEKKAIDYCRKKIDEMNLNMALVKAECMFDRSKIVIYFTSEERLDFRELVHDLASYMKGKVELRQIGVRQEAKMMGGLGSCGRELCCSHVLREFNQVGVKMAKEQSLSLNPAKISGLCSRLMCCLSYEFETYRALCKAMPKVGKKIKINPELEAKVLRHSPLTGQLTLQLSDGRTVTCTLEEMATL